MTQLPEAYKWLKQEPAPRILIEFLNIYGTIEYPGYADSPLILNWAKECGLGEIYTHDAVPWCALAMTLCAKRAGVPYPKGYDALRAMSFANWGTGQRSAMLGDVLVFAREGGAHVGLYVGEDEKCFHVIGGNQSDSVNIARIEKSRTEAIRRTPWKIKQPANIRKVYLSPNGEVSKNEA
jgi:uncharacterized protein (TIGR02594 family)